MTKAEIIDRFKNGPRKCIYERRADGSAKRVEKSKLEVNAFGDALVLVVGASGPGISVYCFKDYGTAWAFTRGELQG